MAVSYTHLDVYKRQFKEYVLDMRIGYACKLLNSSMMKDVYKRQMQMEKDVNIILIMC